jgi:hypothetical protein
LKEYKHPTGNLTIIFKMGFISKFKGFFASKKDAKDVIKHSRAAEHIVRDYQDDFNPASFPPVGGSYPYYHAQVQTEQSSPAHPRTPDGSNHQLPTSSLTGKVASQIDHINHWSEFDGTHIPSSQDGEELESDIPEARWLTSDATAGVGLFAPREGEFRTVRVEKLENLQLKRSNALRGKPTDTYIRYANYAATDARNPKSTSRPFSWVLPQDEPMPTFEQILSHREEGDRLRASDGELEVIRSDIPGCAHRIETMRKVTLGRLEGKRS